MKTIKKHIFVSIYNSSGGRNGILASDLVGGKLPASYVAGKIHAAEASERWFATPNVYENVESSRTDTTTEEFSSGLTVRIQNGVQTFMGNIIQVDATLASRILSNGCSDFGVYEIDRDGSLRGEQGIDENGVEVLYPIKINKGSLDSYDVPEVEGSSVQRIAVTFQYDGTVSEINLKKLENVNIDVDLLKIASNIDGVFTDGAGTTSGSDVYVFFGVKYGGSFGSPIPIQGQAGNASDWEVLDSDGITDIAISGVTESDAGYYRIQLSGSISGSTVTVNYVGTSTDPTQVTFSGSSVLDAQP
jgi:hypothetical protein